MSSLLSHEKIVLEKLFQRDNEAGFVLDFSDATYREFFAEYKIDINLPKYTINGTSKMKRLRAFWEVESDQIVGKVLAGLLKRAEIVKHLISDDKQKALQIINKLLGEGSQASHVDDEVLTEAQFLNSDFTKIDLKKLKLDSSFETVIKQRIEEVKITLQSQAALSVIFLCGSTLEGLLWDLASKNISAFNQANSAPTDKKGKVKHLNEWTLENLINVSHELNFIKLDLMKYSLVLKDFRNYIHPRQQVSQQFNPDIRTAKISWQVLQAAIDSLMGDRL